MNKSKLTTSRVRGHEQFKKFMPILVLAAMLLTACAQSTSQPSPQPAATSVGTAGNPDKAVSAAKSALAKRQNLNVDSIQLVNVQPVLWPDGCLGVNHPGFMCAMHVVDGYRIILSANDQTYEAHSNLDGSQIEFVLDKLFSSIGSGY